MPLDFDVGDGADALTRDQLVSALDGTYWVSGWDATLGAGDLEVDIAAGEGAINGGDVSTASTQTVDFTGDPDPDDPRKAAISVDSGGNVVKTLGAAVPADPENEFRFRTWDPQPPAESVPGVVVAEVWLEAGATVVESADVRDRRVSNNAVENISIEASLTAGTPNDEAANRQLDTQYTNTTGSPLYLSISIVPTGDVNDFYARLSVAGQANVSIEQMDDANSNNTIGRSTLTTLNAIVPAGDTYELSDASATVTISRWYEQTLTVE